MKESVRIVRFAIVGTLNAIIIAAVVWLMMDVGKFGYIISNITAYLIAQIHNFIWCKYWIFPANGEARYSLWKQLTLFSAAFGLAYLSQFLFLVATVELLAMNEYLSQFLGLFIYGAVNFLSNRKITFR